MIRERILELLAKSCGHRRQSLGLVVLGLGLLLIGPSGCSPTKGYAGPELPESQVSLITRDYDSDTVDLSAARVDGFEFGYAGISVLPGEHLFDFQVIAKEPLRDCRPFADFNEYSYEECLKDLRKGKKSSCDCYEYLTIKENCVRTIYPGSCRGEAVTDAGRKYQVMLTSDGRDVRASVGVLGGSAPVGRLECYRSGESEKEEERTIGSGRYVAFDNGFGGYCR